MTQRKSLRTSQNRICKTSRLLLAATRAIIVISGIRRNAKDGVAEKASSLSERLDRSPPLSLASEAIFASGIENLS